MESQDNKSKIILRRLGMNRIQRINIFSQDYKSLNPYLKTLLNEVQEDFQKTHKGIPQGIQTSISK